MTRWPPSARGIGRRRPVPEGTVAEERRRSPPLEAPVLELQTTSKAYTRPKGDYLLAVADVSLHVCAGEFVSIIGPSGCGKSTLIRLAAGLVEPTSGQVLIDGRPRSTMASRETGAVFQELGLLPWRTTLENVALPAELLRIPRPVRSNMALAALTSVGLAGFEDFTPAQLSGGMRQRAAIARALMLRPRVLLLDEPFGALDQITREQLQSDFSPVWKRAGVGVLLVTHDVQEAVFLSDRIVVLTGAPARVAGTIHLDHDTPRHDDFRDSTDFVVHTQAVRRLLQG